MAATIDMRKAHKVIPAGDLTLIFTWVNDERAMVIVPTYRAGAPWFVVCDSAAWKYDEPAYVAKQCVLAAEVLDMPHQAARIGGLINDHLDELVLMPAAPLEPMTRATYGEVKALADGELIGGDELRLPTGGGLTYG